MTPNPMLARHTKWNTGIGISFSASESRSLKTLTDCEAELSYLVSRRESFQQAGPSSGY